MPLLALGLNHQTAPLTLRERVALDAGHTLVDWEVSHFGFNNYIGLFGNITGTMTMDPANIEAATFAIALANTGGSGSFGDGEFGDLNGGISSSVGIGYDFNERFGATFSDEDYDTIGGLVTEAVGHLPEVGDELALDRFMFRVARADARRVQAFHVTVLPPDAQDDA